MNDTKFDLCAGIVTLDYEALLDIARSDQSYALEELHRTHSFILSNRADTMSVIQAEDLVRDARRLYKATVAVHTLTEGQTRGEIKVARDKPKGKEFTFKLVRNPPLGDALGSDIENEIIHGLRQRGVEDAESLPWNCRIDVTVTLPLEEDDQK